MFILLCLSCQTKAESQGHHNPESSLAAPEEPAPGVRPLPGDNTKEIENSPPVQPVQWRPIPDAHEPRKPAPVKPAPVKPEPKKPVPEPPKQEPEKKEPIQEPIIETPPPPKPELEKKETLVEASPPPVPPPKEPEIAAEPGFDPHSITQEVYDATKFDVQHLIESLNKVIRARDYNAWVRNLGDRYIQHISAPEYLKGISESPALKSRNIKITNLRDYFNYVVVPSRADDEADDIEFVSESRIKVYRFTSQGERLRLYDLEKIGNNWKIID